MARYVCAMLLKMKEVFQVIESMKRAAVIEDYAVARAVGALFYVEPFSTADIDFLVRLPLSNVSVLPTKRFTATVIFAQPKRWV